MNFIYEYRTIIPSRSEMLTSKMTELKTRAPFEGLGWLGRKLNKLANWESDPRPQLLLEMDKQELIAQQSPEDKKLTSLRNRMTIIDTSSILSSIPIGAILLSVFRKGASSRLESNVLGAAAIVITTGFVIFIGSFFRRMFNAMESGKKAFKNRVDRLKEKVLLISQEVLRQLTIEPSNKSTIRQLEIAKKHFTHSIEYYEKAARNSPPRFGNAVYDERGLKSYLYEHSDVYTMNHIRQVELNGFVYLERTSSTRSFPNGKFISYERDENN